MGSLFSSLVWSVFWRASLLSDLGNFLPWVYWKCFLCFCHQHFLFLPYLWFVELAFWSISEYDIIFLLIYLSWSECSNVLVSFQALKPIFPSIYSISEAFQGDFYLTYWKFQVFQFELSSLVLSLYSILFSYLELISLFNAADLCVLLEFT